MSKCYVVSVQEDTELEDWEYAGYNSLVRVYASKEDVKKFLDNLTIEELVCLDDEFLTNKHCSKDELLGFERTDFNDGWVVNFDNDEYGITFTIACVETELIN